MFRASVSSSINWGSIMAFVLLPRCALPSAWHVADIDGVLWATC